MSCPFANLALKGEHASDLSNAAKGKCPFHAHALSDLSTFEIDQTATIDIKTRGGTHVASSDSAKLLKDIGGGDRIREGCTRFYARAFEDKTIQEFFFEDDGPEAHGKRLADWIIEKMDSNQKPWTDSGRLGQRQPSHHKAWNNVKRSPEVRGDHFDLKDARVWMRLHFWAFRECFLHEHEPFWNFYQQFIAHFVAVYERQAPRYAQESAEWSANTEGPELYLANDNVMSDVIGDKGPSMLQLMRERQGR